MIYFAYPWSFILFLTLPATLWLYLRRKRRTGLGFSDKSLLPRKASSFLTKLKIHAGLALRLLALALVIVALAGPRYSLTPGTKRSEGLDIVLAIDTSGSMEAMDFEIAGERQNRLAVVKQVISDFVKKRFDDRIGMVVFGSQAYTQVPLTLDHDILLTFLSSTKIGMAGRATAIGDAIAMATKRLSNVKAKSKIIILLTDGSNTAGDIDPLTAADAAHKLGIKIYAIAVGSHEKVPFPVSGIFGSSMQYREVELDEELLKKVSQTTGGKYFLASDTDTLVNVYATIDKLEKTTQEVKDYSDFESLYHYLLILALILVFVELGLRTTRFEAIP
jgi:Ca-activated chloride channel family protein